MRKVARRLLIAAAAVSLLLVVVVCCVYRATQMVPAFYRQALTVRPDVQHADGQRFEQNALALHNQLYHDGRWEIRFSASDINGWLATDFPTKFPEALPSGISQPRIAIDGGVVHLAVRYDRDGVDTVVWLEGDVCLTDQPNEIAVRIDRARAGLVPVPLAGFLQEIGERAARANLPLRWTEANGKPVALVRLPHEGAGYDGRLTLHRLDFVDHEFIVAGSTEIPLPGKSSAAAPNTAAQPADSETHQR